MISAWDRRHGPASGKPQDVKHGSMRDGNEMWRAAAAYSGFDEFVMRGTEELPRVGTPQITYLRAPKFDREVDFIGRTENFVADLQRVQVQLGLEPSDAAAQEQVQARHLPRLLHRRDAPADRRGLRRGHRPLRLHLLSLRPLRQPRPARARPLARVGQPVPHVVLRGEPRLQPRPRLRAELPALRRRTRCGARTRAARRPAR